MRRRTLIACTAPLGLMACAASGDVARFEEGMARAGCFVTNETQAAAVERHTGFDETKLRGMTQDLLESGALTDVPGGIKLTTGKCANA